ncbi:MAG: hypothetical protein WAZ77_21880 [Candidatus Nitrosopolaris sp.]
MSSTIQQQQIEWRRSKVMEMLSKGESNQSEIARILQVDRSIICRDLFYLRQQSRNNIKKYIDERLPEEYEKCLVGLNSIVKEAWTTSQQSQDRREKIQALSLAKDCYAMKLDLLTNATVVHDAIRFVAGHGKSIATVSSDVGTTPQALNDRTDTVKGILETEFSHSTPSTTTNQVF